MNRIFWVKIKNLTILINEKVYERDNLNLPITGNLDYSTGGF